MKFFVILLGLFFSQSALCSLVNKPEYTKKKIEDAYYKYIKSSNASEREELKEYLELSFDFDPDLVLSIKNIKAMNFCDGTDVDMNESEKGKITSIIKKRMQLVRKSNASKDKKDECLRSFEIYLKKLEAPN